MLLWVRQSTVLMKTFTFEKKRSYRRATREKLQQKKHDIKTLKNMLFIENNKINLAKYTVKYLSLYTTYFC
jgi:hypothetical protein